MQHTRTAVEDDMQCFVSECSRRNLVRHRSEGASTEAKQ